MGPILAQLNLLSGGTCYWSQYTFRLLNCSLSKSFRKTVTHIIFLSLYIDFHEMYFLKENVYFGVSRETTLYSLQLCWHSTHTFVNDGYWVIYSFPPCFKLYITPHTSNTENGNRYPCSQSNSVLGFHQWLPFQLWLHIILINKLNIIFNKHSDILQPFKSLHWPA